MHRVKMPIDFGAVVEIPIAQESETMPPNLVGFRHDSCCLVRQMFPEQGDAPGKFIARKEEISYGRGRARNSVPARLQSHATQSDVEPLGNLLVHARGKFVQAHVGQAKPEASFGKGHTQSLSSAPGILQSGQTKMAGKQKT